MARQQLADWDQPCSDSHLADISVAIADWRAVSTFLGLTEAGEMAILESTLAVPARNKDGDVLIESNDSKFRRAI